MGCDQLLNVLLPVADAAERIVVADAAEWIVQQQGMADVMHYLDDILLSGPPASDECQNSTETLCGVFEELGLPMSPSKLVLKLTLHSVRVWTEQARGCFSFFS